MSDDPAGDLKWYKNQIQNISKNIIVSQITRGQLPGQPPFLVLHLKALVSSAELMEQLETWKEKLGLEAYFDIEQIEEEEFIEYWSVCQAPVSLIAN